MIANTISLLVMMKSIFLTHVVLFMHFFCTPLAYAITHELTIYTEHMPPYNYQNDHNDVIGINADIVKLLLKEANIENQFTLLPWKRAYLKVGQNHQSGLISTALTEQRKHLFKWVGPLASSKGYLYQLAHRNDIKISSLEEAKNYTVALIRGGVYHKKFFELGFREGKNLLLFNHSEEYIEPFLLGKIDLILGSDIVIPYLLLKHNTELTAVTTALKVGDFSGNYLALHLTTPDSLVHRLNHLLKKMKSNGTFDKILHYYQQAPQTKAYYQHSHTVTGNTPTH